MFAGLSVILPLAVLFIRATRIIWMLPAGELISIGKMLLIAMVVTGLFCPVTGALFGACWALHRKSGANHALGIYLGEALGAAGGGLIFYFVFLHLNSVFSGIWITSGMVLLVCWWLLRPWRPVSKPRCRHLVWLVLALLVAGGALFGSDLEHSSRRWQWGPDLSAVHDTAHHNIAVLKKDGQVSVFANGLWLFSQPDQLSTEHGVHLALLQHPNPESILMLGGGIAGLIKELFKQPDIRRIDYVEPDPDFIDLLKPHLPPATNQHLEHPQVRLLHQDPRIYIRGAGVRYDVILMNTGDPITAQMNRFYTCEFFGDVKQRLLPGGIFSFAVSGGESMLGPNQARFLGSLKNTLLQIFPDTLIYPGDQVRFFAANRSGTLLSDPAALAHRISRRNLQLSYIREDTLADGLSRFRLDYLNAVLESGAGAGVNRDFFPICHFHNLMMWAAQWHAALQKGLAGLVDVKQRWLWSVATIAGVAIVFLFWTGRCKYPMAVAGSVFATGAIAMVLQVVLLLGFQIMAGFMYQQLALIIAFFMTGLAMGAGLISRRTPGRLKTTGIKGLLIGVQMLVGVLPFGMILFFQLMHGEAQNFLSPAAMGWLFAGLSLITGILGGIHFGSAVMVMVGTGIAVERIGGKLYAWDLAGAAAGILTATLFIFPIYGIMNTLMVMGGLSGICVLILLRRA
jgi:spermidine synthase